MHEDSLCLSSHGRYTDPSEQLLFLGETVLIPFSWWERKAICFVWGFDPVPTSKLQQNAVFFLLLFVVTSSGLSLAMFSGLQDWTGALLGLES